VFDDLMAFANKSIKQNYKVSQDAVTQLQIDNAQEIITKATLLVEVDMDINELNKLLIDLYTTIPRRMDDVRDHLVSSANDKADVNWIKRFLEREQDTLDTMAGQVTLIKQQQDAQGEADEIGEADLDNMTVLDQMGLKMEVETDEESIDLVMKLLGSNSGKASRIIKVVNEKTQRVFDNNFKTAKTKKRRLYWHGSRNENWFNIVQSGLLIRPSGAIHTGSMFGDGIYFANKSQKALGYTSLSGSYWASGSSNKGYLALYDVHTGNQKDITSHNSSCYSLSKRVLEKDGYDSVYAHGGIDLRNDEFIVYDPKQCTIAYLIELK
jgi:poly [ADP-ribose] polymerase